MLHRDKTDAGVDDDLKNATDYYPFFDDPFLSMVKTTTMFVGEIEFSDIPVEGPMMPMRLVKIAGIRTCAQNFPRPMLHFLYQHATDVTILALRGPFE